MKKRLLSVLLVLCMVCTFLPASVLAATPTDHAIKLELVKDIATFSGKDVLRVDFMYKSGSTDTPTNQMVYLKYDANKLYPAAQGNGADASSAATDFSVDKSNTFTKNNFAKDDGFGGSEKSEVRLYTIIKSGFGYICWKVTEPNGTEAFNTFTQISSIFFGLKDGVTFDAMPKDVIKLATVAEDDTITAQTVSVEVTTNSSDILSYGTSGGADTLTVNVNELFVPGAGVTFVEPPKPAYSGTIDAPTVNSNAGGKVVLDAVTPTGGPGGETVQYGYSKTNDGKNITWQNSTTFSSLNVGETYYFYAKVEGTSSYAEKVSAASAAVPVADKALTNLEITTQPSTKTYTHGDTFKTDGMKVKATYNDGSSDTNFTGYTVAYETSGKNYLCKDNTKVTLKAGDKSVEVTSLTVGAKKLTVTDLTAESREYKAGNTSVTLTGGTLNGVVPGETVTLDALPTGSITSADVGNGKDVTFTTLTISGTDAGNYTLTQPTGIKVNITPKNINGANITLNTAPTYDGTEKQVTISGVTVDGSPLNTGDYDIVADTDKATNVESKELKITGTGNYKGTATKNWSLQKATPDVGDFDLTPATPDPSGYNYGSFGGLSAPTTTKTGMGSVTVKYNGNATVPTDAGTYTVTFNVAEGTNYNAKTGLSIGTLKINKIDYTGTMAATDTVRSGQITADKTLTLPELPAGASYSASGTVGGTTTALIDSHSVSGTTLTYSTTDQIAGTKATITIPVTGATNYKDYNVTVTITAQDKQTLTITGVVMDASSYTYGDTVGYNNSGLNVTGVTTPTFDATTLEYIYSGTLTDGSAFTAGTAAPTKAGSYTLTVKVPDSNADYMGQQVINFTIEQKSISTMEVTLDKTEVEYNGSSQSVTASVAGLTAGTDYTVTGNTGTTVANYTVTVTGTGNYKDNATATWEITQATPNVGNVSYAGTDTIYTSTDLNTITLGMTGTAVGSGNLKLDAGQTLTVGTKEYDWTFTPNDTTNYKTVTGKVSLTVNEDTLTGISIGSTTPSKTSYKYGETFETNGLTVTATYASGTSKTLSSSEYTITNGTMTMGQTEVTLTYQGKTCTVSSLTVNKADARTLADITVSQKYTVTTEQSKDIGTAGMPEDAGNLTYAKGSESTSGTVTIDSWSVDTTGKVTYKLSGGAAGATVTLPVTIGSDNYENSTVNVKVTLTDKNIPTANANDINVTYNGADVPASAITGTASVEGTWSWKSAAPKNVADSGNKTVVFKPTDSANYAEVEKTINVTINKATPTGTPTYTAITTSGKKLSDAALAIGSITPTGGSIAWDLGDTTDVTANTAYGWTYTPTDGANYDNLTGTITPYVVSYSGGGSYTPSYTVSVDKTENGTITVSPKSASKGDTVTITVTPDKGYELEMLKALDKDGNALKLTEKNGKYTFTMPTGKVTVKGSFVEEAPEQIFKDVPVDAYYYEAVKWAAEKGITGGVGNDLFAPNQPCTRGQIVTFLWRAAGSPEPKNMSSFADVPADAFYAKAVAWAVENGITGGTGDGKFSPDATCTRAQSVTFLYRAAGSPKVSGSAEFGDVATNAYYADAVAWAAKNGITGGIGGGMFGSDNDCTRAQIVTFLYRSAK